MDFKKFINDIPKPEDMPKSFDELIRSLNDNNPKVKSKGLIAVYMMGKDYRKPILQYLQKNDNNLYNLVVNYINNRQKLGYEKSPRLF